MATQTTNNTQHPGEGWIDRLLYPILWILFRNSKENLLYHFIFKLLLAALFGAVIAAIAVHFFSDFSGYKYLTFFGILTVVTSIMFWAFNQDAKKEKVNVSYNQALPLMCFGKKTGIWLFNGDYEMWPGCSVDLHEAKDLQKQARIIVVEQKTSKDGEPMYARFTYEYLINPKKLSIHARSKPEELEQAIEKRLSAEISDRIGSSEYNTTESKLRGDTSWLEKEIIGTRNEFGDVILTTTDGSPLNGPDPDVTAFENRYGILSLSLSKDLLESLRNEKGTGTLLDVVDAKNRALAQKTTTNAMEIQIHEMTLRALTATTHEGVELENAAKKLRKSMGDENYLILYRKTFEQQTTQWNLLYGKESKQVILTDGNGNLLNVLKQD